MDIVIKDYKQNVEIINTVQVKYRLKSEFV